MAEMIRMLNEHGRNLERLLDAGCDQIGFTGATWRSQPCRALPTMTVLLA